MYITQDTINGLIDKFGQPRHSKLEFPTTQKEFDRIKSSQKNGRRHDVTLYILKDDKFVVIAKPFYPEGMFRAPSGGINPDEDFVTGAVREAREETGCDIALRHFLLISEVDFYLADDPDTRIEWVSYVFQADYLSGDFDFTDKHEIREVTLASLDDFERYSKMKRSLDVSGLRYRAALHDMVKKLLIL